MATAASPKLYFNSFRNALLAGISSAVLLLVAYTIPWLSWLTWIAFVPFILATRGRKRFHVYLNTLLMTSIYFLFVIMVTDLWRFNQWLIILQIALVIILLIPEIQFLSNRFPCFGWIIPSFVWAVIFLIFGIINPTLNVYRFYYPLADVVNTIIIIIPVSQPIFQLMAGTYWSYLLLLAILLVNYGTAEMLFHFRNRWTWMLATAIIGCAAICGLWGGPIADLPKAAPEAQGMDSKLLMKMGASIPKSLPQIRSILVVRHGHMVFERYYQNCTPYNFHLICSDTKSFTGALTGIALHKGYIKSINQKIVEFFPEYVTAQSDSQIGEVTIENLLTMTSGFRWNEFDPGYGSPDWIKYSFQLPFLSQPGEYFNYNTLALQILPGIINRKSHMNHSQFADRYLFGPLGVYRHIWPTDPQGNNIGGADLMLRSRDMAKFGYLYLKEGFWRGKQIIPASWVKESTRRHSNGGAPHGEEYGYLFWITKVKGHSAYFAGGFGGQFIYVVPDLDLVVVITSNIDRHHEENRSIIPDYIIPAIER
jgi:CubicO group peptidase (beta-lactamase class C family)